MPKIKEINSPQPIFNIGSYVAHHRKIKYKIRTWRQLYTIEWICIWTHFNCFVYQYAVQFKLFPVLFDINICLCVRKYTTITPKRIIAHAHNNCCSRLYVCECVLAVIYNLSHESVAKCFFVWMGAFEIHIWSWWTHIYVYIGACSPPISVSIAIKIYSDVRKKYNVFFVHLHTYY